MRAITRVRPAGHDEGVAGRDDRHHRAVDVLGAAVGREQRLVGADGFSEELHRGELALPGLVAVVDAVVHPDVGMERLSPV